MSLRAIVYVRDPPSLEILNQLLLPHETVYESVTTVQQGYEQINRMKVRGAPAIGIVAALTIAIDLQLKLQTFNKNPNALDSDTLNMLNSPLLLGNFIRGSLDHLNQSRPTAVNLFRTSDILWEVTSSGIKKNLGAKQIIETLVDTAVQMMNDDLIDNNNIGKYGAEFILRNGDKKICVVTHCNTGSLATSGYGTALGIIRHLHTHGNLLHAYYTETRPYNQGSRLTSYELLHDKIPSTLICDSMVSALLSSHFSSKKVDHKITAIIVGADRVAKNGDTANKIGTYQLAITAKYHNVMFIVAAPSTSIDLKIKNGRDIIIEERSEDEVVFVNGLIKQDGIEKYQMRKVRVPPEGVKVWNPSFDVTPAELITAIVTEKGVVEKEKDEKEFDLEKFLISQN
ncbi:12465_t:CDS:2 [Dentiscutata heterogama]|uniref:12465_t:CDS:1 n=1 Tax=Dentiscutata heterogama TaxID=1316150 RepID=A0ACA9L324_9GLOM|nr:12465_t:CDS:2 [Dentiscutata heterogama]